MIPMVKRNHIRLSNSYIYTGETSEELRQLQIGYTQDAVNQPYGMWSVNCSVKPDVSFFFAASWCSSFADPFKTLTAQLWSDQSKGYGSESLRRGGHNPKSPRQVNRIDYNISYYCYIQAREPRSFDVWGRPLVGVGGLLALSSCIHVSSMRRSGDVSGELMTGGKGWISFGTTTRSLPKTRIAPALFAVPQ